MRRLLTSLAVLTLAASACAGSDPVSTVRSTWDLVHASGSARVILEQVQEATIPASPQFEGGTFEARSSAEATVDFDAERARVDLEAEIPDGIPGSVPGTHTCSIVVDGSSFYVEVPEGRSEEFDRPWVKFNQQNLPGFSAFGVSDPTATGLVYVFGADEAEEGGSEDVEGVATTKYRVQVEKDKLVDEAPDEYRNQLSGQLQTIETFPFEIWIDGEGLARKVAVTFEQSQGGAQRIDSLEMHLSEFGEAGEIELPAEEDTQEASEDAVASSICLNQAPEPAAEEPAEEPAEDGEATPAPDGDGPQSRFGEEEN